MTTLPPLLNERDGQAEVMTIVPPLFGGSDPDVGHWYSPAFVREYGAACAAAERERCAKLCFEEAEGIRAEGQGCSDGRYDFMADGAERAAEAIRSAE